MLSAKIDTSQAGAAFNRFYHHGQQRLERAALIATDQAARRALSRMRNEIQGAGLGRLGNALAMQSDLESGRGVHRYSNGGFSASGLIFVRSGSERSRGALTAYTAGAQIAPKRGRWLWIPTDEIRRVAGPAKGKQRVTPGNWSKLGLDRKIGRLVFIDRKGGNPVLIVPAVGVSASGKRRSARSLTKSGKAKKGDVAAGIVAFVAIPRTSRRARIDVKAIHAAAMAELPDLVRKALGRN